MVTGASESRRDLAIGVIGGIGPGATLDFCRAVMQHTTVATESDHLRVLVDNNPKLPDMNDAIPGDAETARTQLVCAARGLARSGADILVLICNAAHYFEADIREAVSIPFVSMIRTAAEAASRTAARGSRIGLLATDGCLRARVYEAALQERKLRQVTLDDVHMSLFLNVLRRIRSGNGSASILDDLKICIQSLIQAGACSIVVACTEAQPGIGKLDPPVSVIDPVDQLAKCVVRMAKAPR